MDTEKTKGSTAVVKKHGATSSKSEFQITASTRLQRNQAEKQRRDRLNGYVTELATLVPMVKSATKPLDKVSILRLTAAHMRLNLSCLHPKRFKSDVPNLPASFLSYLELAEKSIGGFVVVTSFSGLVVFCSKSIENFTGYHNIDVMGQPIFNYVHSKEMLFFERKINSIVSQYKKNYVKKLSKLIKMHVRQRPLPRTNDSKYQKMTFKLSIHSNENHDAEEKDTKTIDRKKTVACKDFGTSAVILMFIQPTEEPNINLLFVSQDVYYTIHGLQGEIMFADHRISPITGYLPHEVRGTNAYEYIFDSDVPIALFAQKAMFSSNDGIGLITYRLRIFGSKFIYLQSKGRIVYKDSSTKISHFVCYNRCLSDEEGSKELKKFQERFAPQIEKGKNTDVKESIENSKSSSSKTSVSNATAHFNNLSTNIPSYPRLRSSSSLSHSKEFTKSKMVKVKKSYSVNNPEKQNLCLKPCKIDELSSNIDALSLPCNSSDGSYPTIALKECIKETTPLKHMDRTIEDLLSPAHMTKGETLIVDHSLICSDKTVDVSFAQESNSSFTYFNTNDLIIKDDENCMDVSSNLIDSHKGSYNMGLGKPLVDNSDSFFLSNGHFNNAPHPAKDYDKIMQQVEVSKLFEDASFDFGNPEESYTNSTYVQEPHDISIRCSVTKESSPINATRFPAPCDLDITRNSLFNLDHETAVYNKSPNYSKLNEPITCVMGNYCNELASDKCLLPCIQNNTYLNPQPYQHTDNLLSEYPSSAVPESITLNNGISQYGLNTFHSKLEFESQDLQLSKPNVQPKRRIFSDHLESDCPSFLTGKFPIASCPSKRKKSDKCNTMYDARDKANDSKVVLKVFESHLRNNDTFNVSPTRQLAEKDIKFLNNFQMDMPFVKNSSHKESSDINFNGELYNELGVFFAKFPLSACSPNECSFDISQSESQGADQITDIFA